MHKKYPIKIISSLNKWLSRVKLKRAFEYAQNAQIQIILRMSKVPSGFALH